jgi:hypothetical protein
MLGMPPKYYGAAAPNTKPSLSKGLGGGGIGKILAIVGLAIFVIIMLFAGFALVGNLTKGPQDEFIALTARTDNLQALFEAEKSNITNGDLKVINSQAATLLLSSSFDLSDQLSKLYGVKELTEEVKSAQSVTDAKDELDKAKVNGTFDRTYVTQMTDKVNGTFDMAKKLKSAADSKSAKDVLDKLMASLTAINDQLDKVQL